MSTKKITDLENRIGHLENTIYDTYGSIDEILGALSMIINNINVSADAKNVVMRWACENVRSSLIHMQIDLMNDANLET
jgi:hypothetical protein